MPFAATWMDLEIIILSKVSQTELRQISYDTAYMWNLKKKMIQMNLLTKQKQTHRLRELTYGYWGEGGRGRLGVWHSRVHTATFKIDNQQGPTV